MTEPTSTSPRRVRLLAGVLGAIVLLLLGYAAGLLTPALRAPGDTSAEAGFARDMSRHHAQAVAMSMIAYQHATTPEVRALAYSIAVTQQAQIGMMSVWLQDWKLSPTGSRPAMAWMPDGANALVNGLMPGMATNDQIDELTQATGMKVDILFCQLMLRHHLGGIHMIEGVLSLSHNQQVRDLATGMLNGQRSEVATLQDYLQRFGAQPLGS